ncbi:hypothetical protein I4U23_019274 [Adineta vaga]|nr:hypothetical protein I4U23_019274 [Adineta vaga]
MLTSVILLVLAAICVQSQIELTVTPLPYAYNALEPVLSEHLMRLHHDKHFATYTKKTNEALKSIMADSKANDKLKELAAKPIEQILHEVLQLPELIQFPLRHNGGGYYNHKLFFSMLKAPTATAAENKPTGPLLDALEKSFGSFDKFKEMFSAASINLFGSGWVWLYIDAPTQKLVLNFTANQDNPIMFDKNHVVLMGIDLWEHAYYPVYENRRIEYVDNFWRIVNWSFIAQLYTEGTTKRADL